MNTIFKKQFLLHAGILTISFASMALLLSQVLNDYFTNQKINALTNQGTKIAGLYENAYRRGMGLGIIDISRISNEAQILHEYLDASLIYIGDDYIITSATNDISERAFGTTLNIEELEALFLGERIVLEGNLSGIFDGLVLTVGQPVRVGDSVVGAVLLSSSIPELNKTVSDVYSLTVICMTIAIALSFALTYFSSRSISRPLRQMNDAAKIIANGDLEKRIPVNSRDEVGQLALSFNDMAESLFLQDKLRQEFMANISHDLRSPLTSIRGFVEAVIDGTIPEERQGHYLNIVLEETERLSSLANNILDIEKITLSEIPLNKTRFDINELLRRTAAGFEQRVLEKKLSISVSFADEKNFVFADYEKIQRVIHNLLDNAIKFTPEHGRIFINTSLKNEKVFVSVRDTGAGIAEAEQKRVFDRFYKADASRGQDKKGSGLGLSIVREFIRAHGGTVSLTSETGVGSEFTFSLPMTSPTATSKKEEVKS